MLERCVRTMRRSGWAEWCCAVAALVTAMGAVAFGGDAPAEEELTFDEVLERVEGARARIESASYRVVRETVYHEKPKEGWRDRWHRVAEVLAEGDRLRSRMQTWQTHDDDPDRVYQYVRSAGVRNDDVVGIGYGPMSDVWDREIIGLGSPASRWFGSVSPDYLRYGFGTGPSTLRSLQRGAPFEVFGARVLVSDGRRWIEVSPQAPPNRQPIPGPSLLIDPERGHLVTRVRRYQLGELIWEHEVEPVLIEAAGGEDVWFPRRVVQSEWRIRAEGERRLYRRTTMRFEDVRVNHPVPEGAFDLPEALEWEEGHNVVIWDEEGPHKYAVYRGGDLGDLRAGGGEPEALVGEEAPDFELERPDGRRVKLSEHRGEDIVILEFWRARVPVPLRPMRALTAVAEEYGDRAVVLYGVNLHDEPELIRDALDRWGWEELAVLLDADGAMGEMYGVHWMPHRVIVDKQGVVRDVHVGFAPELRRQLSEKLDALLAGRDPGAEREAD